MLSPRALLRQLQAVRLKRFLQHQLGLRVVTYNLETERWWLPPVGLDVVRRQREDKRMSIVRSIEVIAQSPQGFDQACQEAIKEASRTLRGINSFWIKNAECVVENDRITMYRVNGKISFLVEEGR